MEPRSAEQMPTPIEYGQNFTYSQEANPGVQPEQRERAIETGGERLNQAMPPLPIQPAVAPTQLPIPQPVTQAVAADDSPQQAADEDLIEKEWVDKAKSIISSTKDDPHAREQAVIKLQADYLKKRYGKILGDRAA